MDRTRRYTDSRRLIKEFVVESVLGSLEGSRRMEPAPDLIRYGTPTRPARAGETTLGSGEPNRAVVGLLTREDGMILVVTRGIGSEMVSFPGGGVEPGEELEDAIERELFEETGLELTSAQYIDTVTEERSGTEVSHFVITADGEPRGSEEGDVEWVHPSELVDPERSPFAEYNADFLEKLGRL